MLLKLYESIINSKEFEIKDDRKVYFHDREEIKIYRTIYELDKDSSKNSSNIEFFERFKTATNLSDYEWKNKLNNISIGMKSININSCKTTELLYEVKYKYVPQTEHRKERFEIIMYCITGFKLNDYDNNFSVIKKQMSTKILFIDQDTKKLKIYERITTRNHNEKLIPLSINVPITPKPISKFDNIIKTAYPIYNDVLNTKTSITAISYNSLFNHYNKVDLFSNNFKRHSPRLKYSNKLSIDNTYTLKFIEPWVTDNLFKDIEMFLKQNKSIQLAPPKYRDIKKNKVFDILINYALFKKYKFKSNEALEKFMDDIYDQGYGSKQYQNYISFRQLQQDYLQLQMTSKRGIIKQSPRRSLMVEINSNVLREQHDRLSRTINESRLKKEEKTLRSQKLTPHKVYQPLIDEIQQDSSFNLFESAYDLRIEGDLMYNCIGGYYYDVNSGNTFVCQWTLQNGTPVDLEITATSKRNKKPKYQIRQSYKKYNTPLDSQEYEELIKKIESFNTIDFINYKLN